MKAVFLDRDGTVIVDPPDERVDKIEKIELFPWTINAMSKLAELDFGAFFITNQAGIAEGRIDISEFNSINEKVLEMLEPSGIKILKTYVCPHGPDDNCDCRKPKPTMILQAAKEFDIDLANSYMIGDRESDILAAVNAGTKTILVKTGNSPVVTDKADYMADDLLAAAQYIVNQQ
jgi:D-glycero-D-manno-heptose 1,7-bisphosphate phosphatase